MRDVVVTLAALALTLVALGRADIGVLGWTWLSTMNPHRLAWGFVREVPVAAMVGGATLIGLLFYRGEKRMPWTPAVVALLAFDLWMIVTHFAGVHPDLAVPFAERIFKIQFMIFVTLFVLTTRRHIEAMVWVLVISLGFYGVKGGIFTIATGGNFIVWGPESSFIEGNNEIALALVMTIPLMRYIQIVYESKWVKRAMVVAMLLSAAAAIGSHSRGALLAIAVMALLLWVRGNRKVVGGVLIAACAVALVAFMPSEWENRMGTIATYEEDASAMQRVNVWKFCWSLALARPLIGGGYAIYTNEQVARYSPVPQEGLRNAHSIYFSVLGEHGFVGLALFLIIWLFAWREANWVRKRATPDGPHAWAYWLASMLQVSLVGYLVGGTFLYLAYVDLPYNFLILIVITKWLVRRQIESKREIVVSEARVPALDVGKAI